jgi:hypothetical protein
MQPVVELVGRQEAAFVEQFPDGGKALFRLADAIEKRVVTAMARAEKLTGAILAKAFNGEPAPTEDELPIRGPRFSSRLASPSKVESVIRRKHSRSTCSMMRSLMTCSVKFRACISPRQRSI